MFPTDFTLPMVAPADLGRASARFPGEAPEQDGTRYVEGPDRYTPGDVALAFAAALNCPVEVAVTPQAKWVDAFLQLGFSREAAASYAGMIAVSVDGQVEMPNELYRGSVSLFDYIAQIVNADDIRSAGNP